MGLLGRYGLLLDAGIQDTTAKDASSTGLSHCMTACSIVLISQPRVRSDQICVVNLEADAKLVRFVKFVWSWARCNVYYHQQGPRLQLQNLQ